VRSRGGLVRVAKAPTNLKVSIGHWLVVEEREGNTKLEWLVGAVVEEVGVGAKSLDPIQRWHVCLKQEGASDVVECTKSMFCFSILRSVRTRHAKMNSVAGEKLNKGGVQELGTIIILERNYLCASIGDEVNESVAGV
jgi:hypothetical protein